MKGEAGIGCDEVMQADSGMLQKRVAHMRNIRVQELDYRLNDFWDVKAQNLGSLYFEKVEKKKKFLNKRKEKRRKKKRKELTFLITSERSRRAPTLSAAFFESMKSDVITDTKVAGTHSAISTMDCFAVLASAKRTGVVGAFLGYASPNNSLSTAMSLVSRKQRKKITKKKIKIKKKNQTLQRERKEERKAPTSTPA